MTLFTVLLSAIRRKIGALVTEYRKLVAKDETEDVLKIAKAEEEKLISLFDNALISSRLKKKQ